MLNQIKKSRASHAVVAAAVLSFGALTVSTTPVVAMEDNGHDPNGLYIFGLDPWGIIVLPFKLASMLLLPAAFIGRDTYEGQ
jgi:hypothetical protein